MVTTTSPASLACCPICATGFTPIRRQRFCSPACRQAAWRARHRATATHHDPIRPGVTKRSITIYQCLECDTRYLAEQWCPDCQHPCRRVATGGLCPSCDEPITIDELLTPDQPATPPKPR